MSAIELFNFAGQEVRVIVGHDGEPWFYATEICKSLGLANITMAVAGLDEDEKGLTTVETLGGTQQTTIINESGLYGLVLRSRRPEAKAFKRWITREVLPSIRRTGTYSVPTPREPEQESLLIPRSLPEALRAYACEVEAREAAERKIEELTPAAAAWNAYASGRGSCSIDELSKMLANAGIMMRPKALRAYLVEIKWIFRKGKGRHAYWEAYSEQVQLGRLAMKQQTRPEYDEDGELIGRQGAASQLRVKPKGLEDLLVRLTRERLAQPMLEIIAGGAA